MDNYKKSQGRNFRVDPKTGEIIYEIAGEINTVTGEQNYKYLNSYTYVFEYEAYDKHDNKTIEFYSIASHRKLSQMERDIMIEGILEEIEDDPVSMGYSKFPDPTSARLVGAYHNPGDEGAALV